MPETTQQISGQAGIKIPVLWSLGHQVYNSSEPDTIGTVHLGSFEETMGPVAIWTGNIVAAKGNGQGLSLQSEGSTLAVIAHRKPKSPNE